MTKNPQPGRGERSGVRNRRGEGAPTHRWRKAVLASGELRWGRFWPPSARKAWCRSRWPKIGINSCGFGAAVSASTPGIRRTRRPETAGPGRRLYRSARPWSRPAARSARHGFSKAGLESGAGNPRRPDLDLYRSRPEDRLTESDPCGGQRLRPLSSRLCHPVPSCAPPRRHIQRKRHWEHRPHAHSAGPRSRGCGNMEQKIAKAARVLATILARWEKFILGQC